MLEDVCAQFKQKRLDLGYDIAQIVEKTKLHPMVIRDIEAGRLTNISAAYLKGFIRIYADFLRLDPNIILDALKTLDPPKVEKNKLRLRKEREKKEKARAIKDLQRTPERKFGLKIDVNIFKPVAAIILIIFIVWLIWLLLFGLFGFIGKLFTGPNENIKNSPMKVQDQVNVQTDEPRISKKANNTVPLTLSVTARRKCFIKVKVDGDVLYQGILKKGFIETWSAKKKIEMSISDGSALYMEVNGKKLPALTTMKKPIKNLVIKPTGIVIDK